MGKSTKTETTNAPPQWLQDSLQSFLGGAQGLLGGNPQDLVAGFNHQQKQAFQNINDLANDKFNQKDINRYMSPYQQDVIDATQKQLDLNDAQQQNALTGNIASQGALGGDRQAVMQAQLAGQQDAANNATIANLQNQGYQTALNAYETANQQQLQSAEAQLGAGTMQQQNAQQILDVPYQQYDFLGNLYGDLGGLFGGTSETKQSMPFTLAKGGNVPKFDDGGVTRNIFVPFGGGNMSGGHAQLGVHSAAPAPMPSGGLLSGIGDLSKLNGNLKGLGIDTGIGGSSGGAGLTSAASTTSALGQAIPDASAAGAGAAGTGGLMSLIQSVGSFFGLKDGGAVSSVPFGTGLQAPQKLDDGGDVADLPDNSIVDATGQVIPLGASALTSDQTPDSWRDVATHYASSPDQGGWANLTSATGATGPSANPTWSSGDPVVQGKGLTQATSGTKPGYYNAPAEKPSPWLSLATGVLGALANRSLSKGALMGLQEYHNEELEQNPTVDHSGTTVHVRYNGPGGHDIDTGIPTEAALNAQAMNNYRLDSLQERKDALAAENARAGATLAQSQQVHADSEADRHNQMDIARINAGLPPLYSGDTAQPAGGSTPDLFSGFAAKMQAAENGTGNPSAKNPLSSATGNGQFINQTWLSMLQSVRPQIASSLTPQQQLALRSDPAFSNEMTIEYAKQNGQKLAAAGQPVTASTLALAHRFGPQGALSILNAPANSPMSAVLPPAVIHANPNLANQTTGQYAQAIVGQFGNAPITGGAPSAQPASTFIPKKFLGEPKLVMGSDDKGNQQTVLAQQDERSGQWVTADQNRTPVNLHNMQMAPAAAGGRNAIMLRRVLGDAKDAVTELGNVVELPLSASTGWFGQRGASGEGGLLHSTMNVLANKMTSQEVQDTNASMAGLGRAVAGLETGGLQVSQGLLQQFDKLAMAEGDTNFTKMRKLASFAQQTSNALETTLSDPSIPPSMRQYGQQIQVDLKKAIPWTPHDVTMLERASTKNPQATLADFANQNMHKSGSAPQFSEGQVIHQNGHTFKVIGGKPVYQGASP